MAGRDNGAKPPARELVSQHLIRIGLYENRFTRRVSLAGEA